MLLTSAAQHIQHMHKALQQMNLKLTQVVSAITGVTGMAILKAILAGERDPVILAKLRNPHCQHSEDEIAKALQGTWRAEHLFALQQAVALYDFYHQQLALCDRQIKAHLETFADKSAGQPLPPKARRHKKTNEPRFDARTPLYRLAGVDLTTIEGIEENTALIILSEIGTDMHRWPSVKHFCSWLGLCPQHQISGGKVLSRRVRPGAHRVTVALRLAARTLHHSQSALGALFRRMKARLGTPKAITAAAHKLARLVYSLLQHGSAYVQQGLDAYEAQYRERKVTTMAKQARPWGIHWCPSQRRDKIASPGRSGRARPPRAPPMPRDATARKGPGAGLCPAPYDSHPTRQPWLSNGGPLPKRSSPFPRHSFPNPERPKLAGEFLGRCCADLEARLPWPNRVKIFVTSVRK